MARTSQDRRRRGAAPQTVVASENPVLIAGDEPVLNGRAFSAVAIAKPALRHDAEEDTGHGIGPDVGQDVGQDVGLSDIGPSSDIGPASLAPAHPFHAAEPLVPPQIAAEKPDAPAEPVGALTEGALRSNIDYADWGGIKGWIWDPAEPDKAVVLELLDGDSVLATVVASEYRPDLNEAGIGDGRHGFTIGFTETLLPYARHVLHLRPVGSMAELPSFPVVLTRDHTGFDGSVMRFLLGNVTAETARAQEPDDLAPMITNLVEILDQALVQYYHLAADKAAQATADVLNPADLSPQVQTLVESIQRNYPPIHIDETDKPVVSIIIPVYNKFELTYECVKSIQEHGARIPYEIIIVDDCSRDETILASFAFTGAVRMVRNAANLSFIRTCNRGFEAARGEYVVFLNNDTQVKARWLDELYETLSRDDKIGIAGSKLLYAGMRRHHLAHGRRLELGARSEPRGPALLLHARFRLRIRRGADDQVEPVQTARQV